MAKERPRWKTSYKGPDPARQVIDGKAIVSREELESFREQYGKDRTLRDLLNADRTGKLPPPVNATPAGPRRNPEAEAKRKADTNALLEQMKSRAESRAGEVPRNEEKRELADISRPGRDAIEPMLGPEMGVAGLGRLAVKEGAGALMRGLTGALGRRGAHKAADDLVERSEPVGDLAPLPSPRVWRSGRDDAERVRLMEYMQRVADRGLKKGGSTKAYAKGGSVRGGGCETRTKKTRYV